MNLAFLETLSTVLRTGSFAAAAADRHLSPSAVSQQMKRLEDYFGQPLFDRSSQQVRATAFAHQVMALFAQTLGSMEQLRHRDTHTIEGEVRLGITDSMQAMVLPPTLRMLKSRYPKLIVKPVRGRSQSLIELLKTGEVEAAVVIQPPNGGARRLRWDLLRQEPLVLIAPPDAQETSVEKLLHTYELIRFEGSANVGRLGARYLAARGLKARGDIELQSVLPVVALVSSGLGVSIAFMPDRRATAGYPVKEVSLGEDAPQMRVAFVTRPRQDKNGLVEVVREAIFATSSRRS
jgi:DNA-binding transcriptional LysR family regulator